MTVVDSNIILDIVTDDLVLRRWSHHALDVADLAVPLVINPIVSAEVSVRQGAMEALDADLEGIGMMVIFLPHLRV